MWTRNFVPHRSFRWLESSYQFPAQYQSIFGGTNNPVVNGLEGLSVKKLLYHPETLRDAFGSNCMATSCLCHVIKTTHEIPITPVSRFIKNSHSPKSLYHCKYVSPASLLKESLFTATCDPIYFQHTHSTIINITLP